MGVNNGKNLDNLMADAEGENNDKAFDGAAMHKLVKIDLLKKVPFPPIAISIGLDDVAYGQHRHPLRFGTYGNLSLIKGDEKARKSFLKTLVLGCVLGGKANEYSNLIKGHNPGDMEGKGMTDRLVVDIDTEQDEFDSATCASRVVEMVGHIPDNYMAVQLREYPPPEKMQYLEWIFLESEYRNELGLVSIDGYVDLVMDFNDLKESHAFAQKLMTWSTRAKCHITGVLHVNPGEIKARGHLGTIFQQKCETVVITKDMEDLEFSEIICQRARGKKFKTFSLDVREGLPHSDHSYEPIRQAGKSPKTSVSSLDSTKITAMLEEIYKKQDVYMYEPLWRQIKISYPKYFKDSLSDGRAKDLLTRCKSENWIKDNGKRKGLVLGSSEKGKVIRTSNTAPGVF